MADRKIWVMIIDDNLVVRKTTGTLLHKGGFEILLAEDAEKAMELIKLCTPDCILLDVLMPKVHGYAFLSGLRKTHKTLPVIVVSGIDQQPALVSAIEALGISGWVSKPGNPREIAKMIKKIVEPEPEIVEPETEAVETETEAVQPEKEAASAHGEKTPPDGKPLEGKSKEESKKEMGEKS